MMATCIFTATTGLAQLQHIKYMPYLQGASLKINNPVLTYRYKVVLVDNEQQNRIDSVFGFLSRSYGNYLDSNSHTMSMVSDGYYLKTDAIKKTAHVFNISALQKKLGMQPEDMGNSLISVPDSVLFKLSDLNVEETADVLVLNYKMKPGSGMLKEMVLRINRKDMSIIQLMMTVDEEDRWGASTGYSKIYYLTDFENKVDPARMVLGKYVHITQNNARPLGKLQSYSINSIL